MNQDFSVGMPTEYADKPCTCKGAAVGSGDQCYYNVGGAHTCGACAEPTQLECEDAEYMSISSSGCTGLVLF